MAAEHRLAEAPRKLAKAEVIPKWHPHLADANIGYVFRDQMKSRGREIWAKIRKASPIEKMLKGWHLVMIISEPVWEAKDKSMRKYILDHELCHVGVEWNTKGERVFRMKPHDIEEFVKVVERHGLIKDDVAAFGQACLPYME